MATKTNYNYGDFDIPYNDNMERTDTIPSSMVASTYGDDQIQNPGNIGENVLDGQSIDNLEIKSWIKSANYKPKTHGFIIDGKLGYIECMQLYVGSGGIVGGSLDIPDYTTANSFHVDSSGNMWLGVNTSGPITSAPAYILNDGTAKFTNITVSIQPGSTGVANLSDAGDLAVQDDITDAQAPYSLRGWTNDIAFTATDYNTVIWSSGTIKFSNGTTFSINAGTTGNMSAVTYIYFNGVSNNLQTTTNYASAIGSGYVLVCVAKPSTGALSNAFYQSFGGSGGIAVQPIITADNIVSNYIYTNQLAANQIVAGSGIINNLTIKSILTMGTASDIGYIQSYGWNGSVDGYQLKGGTSPKLSMIGGEIVGGTVKAAQNPSSTNYMLLGDTGSPLYEPFLRGFVGGTRRVQLDNNSLEMWNASSYKTLGILDGTVDLYKGISGDPLLGSLRASAGECALYATFGNYLTLRGAHNNSTAYPIILGSYNTVTTGTEVAAYIGNNISSLEPYIAIAGNTSGLDAYLNFSGTTGSGGFGIRNNNGTMEFKNNAGSWTTFGGGFTGIYAGTGLTGSAFPVPDGGTISHITGSGYNHVPSGGSTNQMLRYQSSGTAQWSTDAYAGYFRDNSSTTKYLHYTGSTWEVNDDFYASGDITAGIDVNIGSGNDLVFGSTSCRIKFGIYSYGPQLLQYKDHAGVNQSDYVIMQF